MLSHRMSRRLSRMVDRISISPRLIIILSAYAIVLMLLSLALLFYPWVVIALSLLAGFVVDKRAWIKNRYKGWGKSRQSSLGN